MLARTVWATERVRHWWQECCRQFNCEHLATPPNVKFSNRMVTTAGIANGKLNYVKLSMHFLYKESLEDYDKTIGHEVAHVFADRHYGSCQQHGPNWQRVMTLIGLKPDRCHTYASTIRKPRRPRTKFLCRCGCSISLGPTHKKRLLAGKKYKCPKCKHPLSPTIVYPSGEAKLVDVQKICVEEIF